VSTSEPAFRGGTLELLARTPEVDIETRSAHGTHHRTTIWVVVADGTPYIRAYRGPSARWYREVTTAPECALLVDGRRVELRVVPAVDAASVEACSRGFQAKYPGDPATPAMIAASNLPTTLRLEPR
jgi:hypothetical protein